MGQVLPGKRQREEDDSPESLPGPKKLCKEQDGSAVAQGCVRPVATPQNLETSAPPTQPSEDWRILASIEASSDEQGEAPRQPGSPAAPPPPARVV